MLSKVQLFGTRMKGCVRSLNELASTPIGLRDPVTAGRVGSLCADCFNANGQSAILEDRSHLTCIGR